MFTKKFRTYLAFLGSPRVKELAQRGRCLLYIPDLIQKETGLPWDFFLESVGGSIKGLHGERVLVPDFVK
jgi:hypothetical protein